MKTATILTLTALAAVTLVLASGPHTSASYTVQPAVLDGGGAPSASANYTHLGSVLDIEGTSVAGVYTAGHGYIAQFDFTTPDGCPEFSAWQITHFGSTANPLAARVADPDSDGVENASEFAFSMNPNAPDAVPLTPVGTAGLPRFAVEEIEGRPRLTVEFIRRPACLSYTLEASADLDLWDQPEPIAVGAPVSLPGGLERVKWADPEPYGGLSRRFLRVTVKM
jgi:hypothetical protein